MRRGDWLVSYRLTPGAFAAGEEPFARISSLARYLELAPGIDPFVWRFLLPSLTDILPFFAMDLGFLRFATLPKCLQLRGKVVESGNYRFG